MCDMSAQIQTMNATLQKTKPTAERSGSTFDKMFRDTEAALNRARDNTPKPKECIPKPTVQISSTRLPTQASTSAAGMHISPIIKSNMPSTSNTRDIGIDPMSMDTSMTEITHLSNRSVPGIPPTKEKPTTFQPERILTKLHRRSKLQTVFCPRENPMPVVHENKK